MLMISDTKKTLKPSYVRPSELVIKRYETSRELPSVHNFLPELFEEMQKTHNLFEAINIHSNDSQFRWDFIIFFGVWLQI